MTSRFFLGLDLGQSQDYSALTIFQQIKERGAETEYHCVHLKRYPLGTSYPFIVENVRQLMALPQLGEYPALVADETGVGRPVLDLLRDAHLNPTAITITFGTNVSITPEGSLHVPKRDLVTNLLVLLQTGRVKFAQELQEVEILKNELLNFKVKITSAGNETFGTVRESEHDDLVLSAALPLWFAEKFNSQFWVIPMGP